MAASRDGLESRTQRRPIPAPAPPAPPAHPAHPGPAPCPPAPPHQAPVWFLLIASGTVGFAFFLMELVWYRLLAPLLGGSVFTFGLGPRRRACRHRPRRTLVRAVRGRQAGFAFGLRMDLPDRSQPQSPPLTRSATASRISRRRCCRSRSTGFGARIAGWTIVTVIVVAPAGDRRRLPVPAADRACSAARAKAIGEQIGRAYAANTFGAMVGIARRRLRAAAVAVGDRRVAIRRDRPAGARCGGGGVVDQVAKPGPARPGSSAGQLALVALLAILFVSATGPTAVVAAQRHRRRTCRARPGVRARRTAFREWVTLVRRGVVWEGDGTESGVALIQNRTGYAFVVNGKSDGSARDDAGTQVVSGLLGALSHPNPRSALVIGLGTGSTAGWLGAVPSIDRVDVVETRAAHSRCRARLRRGQSRRAEQPESAHHDRRCARDAADVARPLRRHRVGAVQPVPRRHREPLHAGVLPRGRGSADRRRRLRPVGSGVRDRHADASHHLRDAGRRVSPDRDMAHQSRRSRPGGFQTATDASRERPRAANRRGAVQVGAIERVARDRHSRIARALHRQRFAGAPDCECGRRRPQHRRPQHRRIPAGPIGRHRRCHGGRHPERGARRRRVPPPARRRRSRSVAGRGHARGSATTRRRGSFLDTKSDGTACRTGAPGRAGSVLSKRRSRRARAISGSSKPDNGRDPTEMSMLADITANTGLDGAMPFIERLREYRPGEADVMLAMLRLTQMKTAEAAAAIESALVTIPRPTRGRCRGTSTRAVDIARILAARDPSLARRMFAALEQPFAVLAQRGGAAHRPGGNHAADRFSRAVRSGRRRPGTARAVDGELPAPPPRLLSGGRPPAAPGGGTRPERISRQLVPAARRSVTNGSRGRGVRGVREVQVREVRTS